MYGFTRAISLALCTLVLLLALALPCTPAILGKKGKKGGGRKTSTAQADVSSLSIYWETECGCTGLEVESSHLMCPYLEGAVKSLAVNVCTPDNPRCAGYKKTIRSCLARASDNQPEDEGDNAGVDVYIAHVGFRGVCGRPHRLAPQRRYSVVRAMFEVDGIPEDAAARCNDVSMYDEVWVPSHFVRDAFIKSGVRRNRIVHIPEAIDINLYNPARVKPIELEGKKGFNFLSIFKLEERKNWKLLLRAFVKEFTEEDDVALHIKANPYMGQDPEYAFTSYLGTLPEDVTASMPMINLITEKYPMNSMPRFYKACDAFVLPTRAEGWGLTLMEAMAMGLPTIGTDFGGSTDFMNKLNSYLIEVERLEPGFDGFNWAQASETHLRRLMRYVFENREAANKVGQRARKDITTRFSQTAVTAMIEQRLNIIADHLHSQDNPQHHDHGAVHHIVRDP